MAAMDADMKKYNAADQNETFVPKSMRVQLARL
jgi:hypothetical protein